MEPSTPSKGYPWLIISIFGIKDQQARNPAVPMLARRRRSGGVIGADPLSAYDTLRTAWAARAERVPVAERLPGRSSSTPFFTDDNGAAAKTRATP
eukprot:101624-Pleurochrysis_carterae.AAC.5